MESAEDTSQRSRNWIGTLNNPETTAEEHLRALFESGKITFTVG